MTTRAGNIEFDTPTLRSIFTALPNEKKQEFLAQMPDRWRYADDDASIEALPQPDTPQALAFLKSLGGYPVLTAIFVDSKTGDKGRIETKSFPQGHDGQVPWGDVFRWVEQRNGKANLYWLVNSLRKPKDSKAAKADIAALRIAHVDVDVRVSEDQGTGIERIVKSFLAHTPRPNFIIRSGGGAQAFWVLDTAILLDGSHEAIADAESINVQLALDLDGDRCFNVDRIMRLPGTVNLPDAVKL